MSNPLQRALATLRAGVRDLGESLLGTELDEQRLQSAREELRQARAQLAGLLAQQTREAREQAERQAEQQRLEDLAVQAMTQQRDDLAESLADRILALQADDAARQPVQAELAAEIERLRSQMQEAEARIRDFERELQIARTREAVARTTERVADQLADGEALRRLRERRQHEADLRAGRAAAAAEGPGALEKQLVEAGLVPDPATEPRRQLLERLRARQAGT